MGECKIVFNSSENNSGETYGFPADINSAFEVLFENEEITAMVNVSGLIEFLNSVRETVCKVKLKKPIVEEDKGDDWYYYVTCKRENDLISLVFNKECEIDYYPHCDGEYDRWGHRNVTIAEVTFDFKTNKVSKR